jgi:hypothetical protein
MGYYSFDEYGSLAKDRIYSRAKRYTLNVGFYTFHRLPDLRLQTATFVIITQR